MAIGLDIVVPHESVGGLVLGTSVFEVNQLMGQKGTRETANDGSLVIEYLSEDIECTFYDFEGYKLGCIQTERPTASIGGRSLMGSTIDQVKHFAKHDLGYLASEEVGTLHDDGHIQHWLDVEPLDLTFWFRDDSLYGICLFYDTVGDDQPIWPAK